MECELDTSAVLNDENAEPCKITAIEIKGLKAVTHSSGVLYFDPKYIALARYAKEFKTHAEKGMLFCYEEEKLVGIVMRMRQEYEAPGIEEAIHRHYMGDQND